MISGQTPHGIRNFALDAVPLLYGARKSRCNELVEKITDAVEGTPVFRTSIGRWEVAGIEGRDGARWSVFAQPERVVILGPSY